jgi:hypothetical protein
MRPCFHDSLILLCIPLAMLGLTVRTDMLKPDPLSIAGCLLETSQPNPKTDKWTVVNLYHWISAKDS